MATPMNELFFFIACALLVAAVICRPDRYLFGHVRRRAAAWNPEPYLGEFVPAETPADRQKRENEARLKMLLKKAEQDW
jgi:hypothetical protein